MRPGFEKVCAVLALACALYAAGTTDSSALRMRFAFSDTLVGDVNDTDMRAAIRGWADAIMHDTAMTIEFDQAVVSTSEQLVHKIRTRTVDGFAFTTLEYFQVSALVDSTLVIDEVDAQGGDEYLVLVNSNGSIHDLGGLRGHTLICYKHPKMCLGLPWLETALATDRLGSSDTFFARKTINSKLPRVVLPVYFQQADACLVSRRGFDTMCELNPQLAKQLRVVARSGRMIASMMGFHKECAPATRKRYAEALTGLSKSVAGRQALMLFQSDRLVKGDTSLLKSAVEMLARYEQIKAKPGAKK